MANDFLFTSESVSEGHPDKVADQVSDDGSHQGHTLRGRLVVHHRVRARHRPSPETEAVRLRDREPHHGPCAGHHTERDALSGGSVVPPESCGACSPVETDRGYEPRYGLARPA